MKQFITIFSYLYGLISDFSLKIPTGLRDLVLYYLPASVLSGCEKAVKCNRAKGYRSIVNSVLCKTVSMIFPSYKPKLLLQMLYTKNAQAYSLVKYKTCITSPII